MSSVDSHAEKNVIRVQLAHNVVLKGMTAAQMVELEPHLVVVDCQKGEALLNQSSISSSTACSSAW